MKFTGEETKEIEKVKKATIDIDDYKEKFDSLVVDGQESIEEARSLQSQVKAAKSQVKAATELEWNRKKKIWEESKEETEKKKKEYYEIRDKRNALMGACKEIFDGIGEKVDNFRAECVRKAEEERRVKEAEEQRLVKEKKDKERREEEAKKEKVVDVKGVTEVNGKCKVCDDKGVVMESDDELAEEIPCPACNAKSISQQNTPTEPGPSKPINTTEVNTPQPPQKPEEEQNRAVTKENDLDFEIYDMYKFLGAITRCEKGATTDLVLTNGDEIMKLAEKLNCKPGDDVISGCRVINFDHGDLV